MSAGHRLEPGRRDRRGRTRGPTARASNSSWRLPTGPSPPLGTCRPRRPARRAASATSSPVLRTAREPEALDVCRWAVGRFGKDIVVASSFRTGSSTVACAPSGHRRGLPRHRLSLPRDDLVHADRSNAATDLNLTVVAPGLPPTEHPCGMPRCLRGAKVAPLARASSEGRRGQRAQACRHARASRRPRHRLGGVERLVKVNPLGAWDRRRHRPLRRGPSPPASTRSVRPDSCRSVVPRRRGHRPGRGSPGGTLAGQRKDGSAGRTHDPGASGCQQIPPSRRNADSVPAAPCRSHRAVGSPGCRDVSASSLRDTRLRGARRRGRRFRGGTRRRRCRRRPLGAGGALLATPAGDPTAAGYRTADRQPPFPVPADLAEEFGGRASPARGCRPPTRGRGLGAAARAALRVRPAFLGAVAEHPSTEQELVDITRRSASSATRGSRSLPR